MTAPISERLRPQDLADVVGHQEWLSEGAPLRVAIERNRLRSIILWGPPGCGKTTIARVMATQTQAHFIQLSAVLDGMKRLREVVEIAKNFLSEHQQATLLFVDEIHRWNKAQQDALLPHLEAGILTLIGATTENPSFEIIPPLRSRLQIIRLEPLKEEEVAELLRRALSNPEGLGTSPPEVEADALQLIAKSAAGDGRRALDDLERCIAVLEPSKALTAEGVIETLQRRDVRHDRSGDDHYDVTSAFIKSMRGSDPNAAVYWLARMLEGGEDPLFIARRMVIFASEDIGNADPRALQISVAAADAVKLIGLPEARIPLAQAATWLASSPKSNAAYMAINQALKEVRMSGALPVPFHLRNQNYSGGDDVTRYKYPHDHPHHIVEQQYLPDALSKAAYYSPTPHGEEKTIQERMAWWARKLKTRSEDSS